MVLVPPLGPTPAGPSPRKIQTSFYALSVLFALSYGPFFTANWYYIFGAHPESSEASTKQAEYLFKRVNALIPTMWLIFLFLVPAFMDALRGPRNSFFLFMFVWAVAFCFLVGAFVVSKNEPNRLVTIFGIVFSILIGCFGGLGYTASESYLDLCAE